MDLMTLAAKIVLDDSGFEKGVKGAEKAGSVLAQKMSAMTVAVGNIAADMIKKGFGAIQSVVGGAIDSYADYQQLIGGVETLFKQSANRVAQYAKQSYKTTGLSANQYMETVTSFSAALLHGLEGDTEAAADMANMAVTDMADNANKMGTDIGSIQAAYQGFAKQNYTMLDNLKLGYGGTQQEMVRLINDSGILNKQIKSMDGITFDQVVAAIHKVQTEMGVTGTTAKEAAETISGSKASLAAAWEDLLSAIGGEGGEDRMQETLANFKESFSTYMENFIPTLTETIVNSGSLVEAIAGAVSSLPTTLLTELTEGGLDAGIAMIGAVQEITGWVIDSITNAFSSNGVSEEQVAAFGAALGEFIGSSIQKLVTNAPQIIFGAMNLGINLAGGIVAGLSQGLFGEDSEVSKITDQLEDELFSIDVDSVKAQGLIEYMGTLADKYGTAASQTDEWKSALSKLNEVLPGAGKVVAGFGSNVEGAVKKLQAMNAQLRNSAIMKALTESMTEQYELLARQTMEYTQNRMAYERSSSAQETYRNNIVQGIQGAAQQQYDTITAPDYQGYVSQDFLNDLQNFSKGLADANTNLGDLDFTGLEAIVGTLMDPELSKMFETNKAAYEEAQGETDAAKAAMDAAKAEMDATKGAIADTEAAMTQAAQELDASGTTAANAITSGGDAANNALVKFAGQVASIRIPDINFGGPFFTPKAVGMDEVPYNGFRAELHKGEMVLTASEARSYRSDNGVREISGAIMGLRNDIRHMQLIVGEEAFGRATVNYGGERLDNYIGEAANRELAGYGW